MSAPLDDGDSLAYGMWRRVFEDVVIWQPDYIYHDETIGSWDYAVEKYPLVPGFHVVYLDDGDGDVQSHVLSSHKTLHEAMGVCRVLLAADGVRHV